MLDQFTCPHHEPSCKIIRRFWPKVSQGEMCWEWTAALTTRGYGKIGHSGRLIHAHRLSWEIHYGQIPEGLWVLHHCDNRKCVRPDHLFLGTCLDNSLDMHRKGRARTPRGDAHWRTKVSNANVVRIRAMCASGVILHREIAAIFDVNISVIKKISAGTARMSAR